MKKYFILLNITHIFNDGYKGAFLLLLPFIAKDLHLSLTSVGILATVVNSASTLLAIPTGYLSGKFGGMKILLLALIVYGFGFTITGFTKSFFFLPITFFITGIGFGVYHTISFALVAKFSDSNKRGKSMSEFSTTGEIGRIGFSALITFLAGTIGWGLAAISFGVVAMAAGISSFLFNASKHEENHIAEKKSLPARFRDIAKDKNFLIANLTGVLDVFASGSIYIFLPFLLVYRHVPLAWVGFFTAIFFIGSIIGKMVLGSFIDKYGNEKIFIMSEIAMALFIVILSNIPSIIAIVIASTFLGIFTKGTFPITQTMVSKTLEKHGNFEKGFALNNFTQSIANFLGPVILGLFADHLGIITAFNISAIFAILAIVPAFALQWRQKRTQEETLLILKED